MGHKINSYGIKPDDEKVEAIVKLPQPKSAKQILSFLGGASYFRKFIRGFATIARRLYDLTKRGVPYVWTREHEVAFRILKEKLINAPVLVHFISTIRK